ncbi:hypothetical protein SAMN05444156_1001 [Verrucomicrobium sp. GAS474]|uniref:hypothetical protein n=1 Tax=Verrucomicrobium sp. GAS474 TaxID=1882831 RepID=UPI000879DA69|nr:hypothetical protein [Verrucomicrobium sp. GAS474]SDT95017.1 hypothetical protein SAMN05444156_1001 [Verrucomicrobium sp. GAS474]
MRFLLLIPLLLATGTLRADEALSLSALNPDPRVDHLSIGIHIKAPGFGELVLELPQIVPEADGPWENPIRARLVSDAATLTVPYPCGATFRYALEKEGTLVCTYAGMPATARGLWFPMMIPVVPFRDGGRYAFNASPGSETVLKPFPREPGGKFIETRQPGPFLLVTPAGARLSLAAPSETQGLTDFRSASWAAFSWTFSYLLAPHPGSGTFTLHIASTPAPAP